MRIQAYTYIARSWDKRKVSSILMLVNCLSIYFKNVCLVTSLADNSFAKVTIFLFLFMSKPQFYCNTPTRVMEIEPLLSITVIPTIQIMALFATLKQD